MYGQNLSLDFGEQGTLKADFVQVCKLAQTICGPSEV